MTPEGHAKVTSALEVSDEAFGLDGFSKRYAMTGFRLGYAIAPEWALRRLQIMGQNLFISPNHGVQLARARLRHQVNTVLVERVVVALSIAAVRSRPALDLAQHRAHPLGRQPVGCELARHLSRRLVVHQRAQEVVDSRV